MSLHPSSYYPGTFRITLITAGLRLAADRLAEDHVLFRHQRPIPTGPAEVIVSINGTEHRRQVTVLEQQVTSRGLRVALQMV
ncbi:hypothetical protein BH23VER1_BH23VER1_09620 [soil metagenome]